MKRVFAAILLFDLMAGLLFFGSYEMREGMAAAADGQAVSADGNAEEEDDVKKIAITFDGDVIIGYKL